MKILTLATALLTDSGNNVLLVRKHGTEFFMQPGGKINSGETAPHALIRELREELEVNATTGECEYLARFKCRAANENNTYIDAKLFLLKNNFDGKYAPSSEIEEIKWVNPFRTSSVKLAPLTKYHVFPLWRRIIKQNSLPSSWIATQNK